MSDEIIPIQIVEPDGKLLYTCDTVKHIGVRVALHERNGTKRCPVEVLHEGKAVISTDADLRQLRDVEGLFKHTTTLLKDIPALKDVPWLAIFTAVAKMLPKEAPKPWTPVSRPLGDFPIERRDYWWYPWISKGGALSIEGDPNAGKTALLIKILAHFTSGEPFPTLFPDHPQEAFPPQKVLLFTYEDDPATTLHPRLVLNGGNATLVEYVEGKRDPETQDVIPLTLQDLPQLETLLKQHHPALMCFDPLQSFLGPGVNMNDAGETRPILDAINILCKRYGCTPCYIRHNGKTQRAKAIHNALGSIDITGAMRSSLTLYKDPEDPQRRILAQSKHAGRASPSLHLKLVGVDFDVETDEGTMTIEEVRVDWDGLSDLTAEDLNAREFVHDADPHEEATALDQAREFLRDMLPDGPMLVEDLLVAAKQASIKRRTLDRAKNQEGVKARRVPADGAPSNKWPWAWHYPTTGDAS